MAKWTDFVVSKSFIFSITNALALTNTLAYQVICTLRIRNAFIVQAPEQFNKLFGPNYYKRNKQVRLSLGNMAL